MCKKIIELGSFENTKTLVNFTFFPIAINKTRVKLEID
ncbi:hypothetical protein LEP1GSC151_1611 [Leptospira interrogans serovar Grippotyphosa str. LT2186]|uniref:Uncharacterized protein n=1 Tax=Leptospira interrogans serovar Grippotyphosa str. LT2186 TaxID=1001599 RepID=M3H9H4_LEPIR|nr:hypothetical protein LEP1GSC151_1611 [Leptospira interrogans serovar Grippotyphosa str. LT2186]